MWKKIEVYNSNDRIAEMLGLTSNKEHYSVFEGDTDDGSIQIFGTDLADRVVNLLNADDADAELTAPSKELQISDNPDHVLPDGYGGD